MHLYIIIQWMNVDCWKRVFWSENNYPNLLPGDNHGQLQNWVLLSAWDGSCLLHSPGAYMSLFYRRGDWGWQSERTYLPKVAELVHSLSLPLLQPPSLITEEALPPSCWGPGAAWGLGSSWVLWGPVRLETFAVAGVQPDWSGYALIKLCWLQPPLPVLVYSACTQTHLRDFWELESFHRKAGSQRDHLRVDSDSGWGLPPVRSFCVLPFHSRRAPLARKRREKPLYFLSVSWKENIKNHFLCVQKMYQVSETCTYPDLFEKQLSNAGWVPSWKLCILYFI